MVFGAGQHELWPREIAMEGEWFGGWQPRRLAARIPCGLRGVGQKTQAVAYRDSLVYLQPIDSRVCHLRSKWYAVDDTFTVERIPTAT
jgi:hypothetical protein